jgi:thiamine kinase-like enzyme
MTAVEGENHTNEEAMTEAVRRVAPSASVKSIERLSPGYMHTTLMVTLDSGRVVVKVLNEEHASAGLTMPIEQLVAANRRVGEVDLGPRVLDFDPAGPTLVLSALDGHPLGPKNVRKRETLVELASVLRRLHRLSALKLRLDPFTWLNRYSRLASSAGDPPPKEFRDAIDELYDFAPFLQRRPQPLVTCHNDLLAANLIATPDGLRLVDFDFAGMNEPAFDLGDLTQENELTVDEIDLLATSYLGHSDRAFGARVQVMSILATGLWGYCAWLAGIRAESTEEREGHLEAFAAKRARLEAKLGDRGLGDLLESVRGSA